MSPPTRTVIMADASPEAKVSVPVGMLPPAKSAPLAIGLVTDQLTTDVADRLAPERIARNTYSAVPLSYSRSGAETSSTLTSGVTPSSLTMVEIATLSKGSSAMPVEGADRMTAKASLPSTVASPATETVTVASSWPAVKVRMPPAGRMPSRKSPAVVPRPATDQFTVSAVPARSPERWMV